ncbi:hypothetical protein [Photobacterium damselae]|uniref:hypothetical protein n=1 Tax=Photobacterium damselae TaxID=38293 RepID=UPI00406860F7
MTIRSFVLLAITPVFVVVVFVSLVLISILVESNQTDNWAHVNGVNPALNELILKNPFYLRVWERAREIGYTSVYCRFDPCGGGKFSVECSCVADRDHSASIDDGVQKKFHVGDHKLKNYSSDELSILNQDRSVLLVFSSRFGSVSENPAPLVKIQYKNTNTKFAQQFVGYSFEVISMIEKDAERRKLAMNRFSLEDQTLQLRN